MLLLEEAPETLLLAKEIKELFEEKYEVEAIVDKRKRGQKVEYLVKQKDYLDNKLSQKFREYLLYCKRKIQEFEVIQRTPTVRET